ncbi:c-type cytochrome [Akkermansiaceae bacterium]|nr:c-type cytochrome [Akkermansiaceae bacterium]
MNLRLCALSCLITAPLQLVAEEFPKPYNSEPLSDDSLISAEKAAAGFKVPEGFEVSVYASEPEVQNPIAMAWDHRGRMWVAENYTYAERARRFDFNLSDRVVIFEDADHDGKAEKRKVFIDTVKNLTSIEKDVDGLWLMCPPQLLFVPDRDGNDVPDGPPEVILDGFTVAKSNYHNYANGLKWGPDGWLYGRCGHSCPGKLGLPGTAEEGRIPIDGGIWRYHPTRKVVEVLTHGTTNPWGHDWDENGELFFINTVNGHLWHMIPGAHFKEPFGPSQNPLIYDRLEMHADHWHFDTGEHWTKSRDGKANDFGGGHAHIGMAIYQADHLPEEWRGKLLTWNMHGRRLNREKLTREGSGYVASHEPDAFLASDEWFRGLEISQGPDGALYALDWSDTGECHDSTGVHRTSGRIYRFSYGTPEKPDFSDLENITPEGLKRLITHPNVWYFRQALRFLPKENNLGVLEELSRLSSREKQTAQRLRALAALGQYEDFQPMIQLMDSDEHIRVWAIRHLADDWRLDTLHGPQEHPGVNTEVLDYLVKIAREDSSALVRLTLASTLQRIPADKRLPLAKALVAHRGDACDHNLPHLVWFGCYSLGNKLPELARATEWPQLLEWIARAIGEQDEKFPAALDSLIAIGIEQPAKAPHLLKGLRKAYQGRTQAKKPTQWDTLAATQDSAKVADLSDLFGDGRSLDSLHRDVLDQAAPLPARERALRSLIRKKYPQLRKTCLPLLSDRSLNQLALEGLASLPHPDLAEVFLKNRKHFRGSSQEKVIATLITRPEWATVLLDHIASGKASRSVISPYQARQLLNLNNDALTQKLTDTWGALRSTSEEKQREIVASKKRLTPEVLAKTNHQVGQKLFQTHCAACHKLHGKGGNLGPDLTGSGRTDLDYLLTNIIDPNALVSANHHLTTVVLKDGRTLTGIIARRTDKVLALRILEQEEIIPSGDISKVTTTQTSIMPEGILDTLKPNQQRDLLGYLMKK